MTTFTQALEQAELLARQSLDASLHERLSCATALVRQGSVFQDDAGHWTVASATTPGKRYSVNGSCSCEDAHFRAPQGRCKHKLSQLLARKVAALMQIAQEPARASRIDEAPLSSPSATADTSGVVDTSPALPEAPVSITLKASLDGHEVMVTLRGLDFASVKAQVEEASAWLKAHAPRQPQGQGKDWCVLHNVRMRETTKEGRSWWSHYDKTAGKWCKGKG